jgi:putative inorganic carbon (HCO3(-)) transporter
MRDLIVIVFTVGCAFYGFIRPWMGVLALAVFAYLNPHRYAWGFSLNMPVYFIVFIATIAGIILNGEDRQPFPWTRETKLFVILLAWFTLTTFWEPDFPGAAREQWVKVMKIYIGIFPTFWMINSREKLRWLIIVIALSFGVIGLKGGIFAFASGFSYRVYGPNNTFYGGNNEIALALNMVLPLIILSAKETESTNAKIFFYVIFIFSICSIISSWSRGGLLTLCVVLSAMVILSKKKWLSVPLLLMALFFALPNLPEQWFSRMQTIDSYQEDASVQGRFQAWHYAEDRAFENPLRGGGFETFRNIPHDAHSAYFEILGEHGFIALALWLSLLFGTMIALERIRRQVSIRDDVVWMKDYARAIQISLLGYGVGGAFLGVAYWDIFYHLVGLCVLLKVMLAREVERDVQVVPLSMTKEPIKNVQSL